MSCNDTTPEQVEKIKIGMTNEQVQKTLGEMGWNEYRNGEYTYGWKYNSPDGFRKTFWVVIKDNKVVNMY